jgi:hypothetical protein
MQSTLDYKKMRIIGNGNTNILGISNSVAGSSGIAGVPREITQVAFG